MNQLNVILMYTGTVLIILSIIWILCDRKRGRDEEKKLDEKKKELIEIIADAEQIIEELNKFSDYIISQIDQKKDEMWKSLQMMSEQAKQENFVSEAVDSSDTKKRDVTDSTGKKTIPKDNKYLNVIKLSQKGMSSTEIARNLKMGKGEVQLILELNR